MEVGSYWAVVDSLQNHVHDLLDYLISSTWHAEFSLLAVRLRDEGRSDGLEVKLLGAHLADDRSDSFERASVYCLFVRSRRHVSGFRLNPFVGQNVQIFPVHEPVEIVVLPLPVAIQFSQSFQSLQGLLTHPSQPLSSGIYLLESFPPRQGRYYDSSVTLSLAGRR